MYSLTIGMPSGGTVRAETMTSLISAMNPLKEKNVEHQLTIQIGGYVAHNRNKIVEIAKQNKSTHIMFIDADMVFPPSGIMRLIDHDKDIVAAMYNARGVPGQPIISTVKPTDPEKDPKKGEFVNTEFPAGLFKVFGLGTGFMLIKTSVFKKLEKPYFVAYEDENGEHHTEDIDFCAKAGKAGFDVWCSPTIQMNHIGTYFY